MRCVLGIDLGSSSCKVSAMGPAGETLATGERPVSSWCHSPGIVEQDARQWYEAACGAIRDCLAGTESALHTVEAVAVVAGAHFFVLLDAQGEPIDRVIHWSDRRAYEQAQRLRAVGDDEFARATLQPLSAGSAPAQLLWIRSHRPDSMRRARTLLPAKDYIRYRLTGETATDPYDATGLQLWDTIRGTWSASLCEACDVDPGLLPEVRRCTTVAGAITRAASRETGLAPGTPVVAGTGDSAAEAASVGLLDRGDAVVKLGTSANVEVVLESARRLPSALIYPYVTQGRWLALTATNAGASVLGWFVDRFLGVADRTEPTDRDSVGTAELVSGAAAVPAGADGVLFHPFLAGERSPYWSDSLRGSFMGLRATHSRAHLLRATLEGVAYSIRECYESLESPVTGTAWLIGGGARHPLWRQIVADVLDLCLRVPRHSDASSGACMMAGVGSGLFETWHAIHRNRDSDLIVTPEPRHRRMYDTMFEIYQEAVASIATVSEALAGIPTQGA